jgi:hypothetical protein
VSQPPIPPGPPTQPQSWPQQGTQPPADRGVDPDPDSIAGWTPPPWTAGPDAPAGWTPPPWTAGPDAPAGSPLYAADTRPFWRRSLEPILVVIGCAVLIGIGIFFAATDDDYGYVRDLAVGECFDYGNAKGEVLNQGGASEVLRQPCTVAHDGEIIGDVTLPEGPYPGYDGVDEVADRACSHDFTNYVGKSTDESELNLDYWTPTESLWNDGDRLVVCEVYGFAGIQLTGTIKNSHQ